MHSAAWAAKSIIDPNDGALERSVMSALPRIVVLSLVLTCGSAYAEEIIVFSGYPASKIESGFDNTAQSNLTEEQAIEYRVLIIKRDGKYYWASRDNKELVHFQSGIAHWFISPTNGYIKIIDPTLVAGGQDPAQFVYMEHVTLILETITYWGAGDELAP